MRMNPQQVITLELQHNLSWKCNLSFFNVATFKHCHYCARLEQLEQVPLRKLQTLACKPLRTQTIIQDTLDKGKDDVLGNPDLFSLYNVLVRSLKKL